MFDPFKDFNTAGYLRNFEREKDLEIVKIAEHEMFRANLPDAISYLQKQRRLAYSDFLRVHQILFKGFYPWAGLDRARTAPESIINKGKIFFAHPLDAERAVNEGLRLGQDHRNFRKRPGEVMGLFAYGHPFLDGNGRTMLLVHADLCRRAGFCIRWGATRKNDYLRALTEEINTPGKGILDGYLLQFEGPAQVSSQWYAIVDSLPGLDGTSSMDEVAGAASDPNVAALYNHFEKQRGYEIRE